MMQRMIEREPDGEVIITLKKPEWNILSLEEYAEVKDAITNMNHWDELRLEGKLNGQDFVLDTLRLPMDEDGNDTERLNLETTIFLGKVFFSNHKAYDDVPIVMVGRGPETLVKMCGFGFFTDTGPGAELNEERFKWDSKVTDMITPDVNDESENQKETVE